MQLLGEGSAYVDGVSLDTDDAEIRSLIKKIADARDARDGLAVAGLYSEDGEYLGLEGRLFARGRKQLTALWSSVKGQAVRTVQSVDFPSPNVAIVHVLTNFGSPGGVHREIFILVKDDSKWLIHVHQTLEGSAPTTKGPRPVVSFCSCPVLLTR